MKIAEGARLATAGLHLETLLHGHLAGEDAGTAVVLIDSDQDSVRIARRADIAEAALAAIGMPTLRLAVPAPDLTRSRGCSPARALCRPSRSSSSRARRLNPDLIRREEEPYRRAGDAGDAGW